MKRALLLVIACACARSTLRADAAPTQEFPTAWGARAAATAPPPSATSPVPPPQAEKRPSTPASTALLAVLDFSNKLRGADKDALDGAYFANQVRAEVKRTFPRMGVMTRENIMVLLQTGGRKLSECEGECEVDTGRRLGADYVISGDLLRVGTQFKLDLRLHDTRDGQLISGATASGHSADELDANLAAAAASLLRPLGQ